MSDINVNELLAQMRTLANQSATFSHLEADRAAANPSAAPSIEFGAMLKASIDDVNQTQMAASQMAKSFETGANDADLAEVMVSLQKADLSFKAMTEVRNKLVNAYQEIMNMPV